MPETPRNFEERVIRRLPDALPLSRALPRAVLEAAAPAAELDRVAERVRAGLRLAPPERRVMRSIISPGLRPAVEVLNDVPVAVDHPLWQALNDPAAHEVLSRVCKATGRIEFTSGGVFINAGTGFFVGENLVMTNRHVAEAFSVAFPGFGIFLRPGFQARINLCREAQRNDADPTRTRAVVAVEMLHPWFDLALLRTDGGPDGADPLELSTDPADAAPGEECCVVGYPSFNSEEDPDIQRATVANFDAKHVSPGIIDDVRGMTFKGRTGRAIGHDSSTLTGNSGAPLVRLSDGKVVGLHFHGNADGLNWAIPAADIASDIRIVDAAVAFAGVPAPAEGPWTIAWAVA